MQPGLQKLKTISDYRITKYNLKKTDDILYSSYSMLNIQRETSRLILNIPQK